MTKTVIVENDGVIITKEEWEMTTGVRCPFCPGIIIWNKTTPKNTYFCTRCGRTFIINRMNTIKKITQSRMNCLHKELFTQLTLEINKRE